MKSLTIFALISAVAYAAPKSRDGQYRTENKHLLEINFPGYERALQRGKPREGSVNIEEDQPRMMNMDRDPSQRAEEIVRGLANANMERDPPSRVEGEERKCVEDGEDRDSSTVNEEDEVTITRQVPLFSDRALERAVPRPVARTRPRPASPAPIDRTVTDNRDGTERQRQRRHSQMKSTTRTCLDRADETGRNDSLDRERERC